MVLIAIVAALSRLIVLVGLVWDLAEALFTSYIDVDALNRLRVGLTTIN
jgi:hypothetical protein